MSRLSIAFVALGLLVACQKPTATQAKVDASAPVASWKGGSITAAELDAQTFDMRKQTLDQMLIRRLIEQKAKEENITAEALFKREVVDKAKKPTDDEMKKFYDEQAAKQQLPPFEQVKDQIAQYLEKPAMLAAQQAFADQLKKDYAVEVALKPPRLEVAAEGPARGAPGARVTIVEFSDYQCPYCSRAEETVKEVMKAYDGKIRLVYRDYPLPFHPQAQKAAEAAHCAGDQGKYWEMHEKLFANQQALEPPALKGYAKDLGLDQGKFDKCLDAGEKASLVETNRKAGEKVGVTGTPAFFINGYLLSGAQPIGEFKSIIDSELARK
ncbi:MAG TPA: thioredoxin domain-containing protein [Anaeromyxobacteraceae bacterium]|nr:thioredoxin domain-containing protein [Anaeromyxobacteraceae bacterium]